MSQFSPLYLIIIVVVAVVVVVVVACAASYVGALLGVTLGGVGSYVGVVLRGYVGALFGLARGAKFYNHFLKRVK